MDDGAQEEKLDKLLEWLVANNATLRFEATPTQIRICVGGNSGGHEFSGLIPISSTLSKRLSFALIRGLSELKRKLDGEQVSI